MNLGTLCQVKEVKHRRPHIVRFHFYEISRIDKFVGIEGRLVVARCWRSIKGMEQLFNKHGVSYWCDENIPS